MVDEALGSSYRVENVYRKGEIGEEQMKRISALSSPSPVLAVVRKPDDIYVEDVSQVEDLIERGGLFLGLDTIRDPGNLGTIIRVADWFGIEHIFCSQGTVDVYNSKVIQATMGALARVKVHYCNLPDLISSLKDVPVYGTFLDGENIYNKPLSENGLIIMGNEGNGVSKEVSQLINNKLYIPNYPTGRTTSESLNVAIATAVVCAEFRRRLMN